MSYARKLDDVASLLKDLDGLTPIASSTGLPLELPLASIEEDPDQPRRTFDAASLEEMAASIRERGILQPIGVRPTDTEGVHRIVFGARRFRAAHIAGRTTIPAIIVKGAGSDPYDQMIENIQRDDLAAVEIAGFIASRLEAGETQKEIGQRLGKPKSYIAMYASVVQMAPDLKACLATSPIRAVYDVHQVWKRDPEAAVAFCATHENFTRAQAETFVASFKQDSASVANPRLSREADKTVAMGEARPLGARPAEKHDRAAWPPALRREASSSLMTLLVEHGERSGRLVCDRGSTRGNTFGLVDFSDAHKNEEVPLAELKLVALTPEAAAPPSADTKRTARGLFTRQGRSAAEQPKAERVGQGAGAEGCGKAAGLSAQTPMSSQHRSN